MGDPEEKRQSRCSAQHEMEFDFERLQALSRHYASAHVALDWGWRHRAIESTSRRRCSRDELGAVGSQR